MPLTFCIAITAYHTGRRVCRIINADRLKRGLEFKYGNVYMTTALVNGQKFYRVRIGEFSDYDNAYSLAKIIG
jgi:rare lipoprotein A